MSESKETLRGMSESKPLPHRSWDLGAADAERLLADSAQHRGESLWQDAWRRLKRNPSAWWSLVFVAFFTLLSFLGPLLPIPSPSAIDLQLEPRPPVAPWVEFGNQGFGTPSEADPQVLERWDFTQERQVQIAYWSDMSFVDRWMLRARVGLFGKWQTGHWFGTDSKGRDLLSRIVWGSRTSILVALAATLCSLVIGVSYGALSGFLGGRVDNLMMRIVDVLYSIPFIFVVIFVLTMLSAPRDDLASDPLLDKEKVFFIVIGAIYWLTMARVVRGQVLSLKHSEFIEAARVLGASTPRIVFVHLIPNVLSIVVVYLTLTIPSIMLFEAFLSFLGLGIEPPKVSWGLLAVDGTDAINPIRIFWWLVVFPALAMGATLLSLNFLGDGLRDVFDPKMRGKD